MIGFPRLTIDIFYFSDADADVIKGVDKDSLITNNKANRTNSTQY